MKEQQYFLRLENTTKSCFKTIKDEVNVIVPLQMSKRFHKIHTDTEDFCGTTPKDDLNALKTKYKNCDVFYLNIVEIFDGVVFDLSNEPDIVAAFVCIPKNGKYYKEKPEEYIDFVRIVLADYYNDENIWTILVMNKDCEKLENDKSQKYYDYVVEDYTLYINNDRFNQEHRKFFEKCKAKYGIPQTEIDLAKKIMKSHYHNNLTRYKYSITPYLVRKLNSLKTPMNLPIKPDKNGFKQDLYAIKHIYITGRTGTGKTTLLKSFLTSIEHQPKTANCKIVLVDTKDFDFKGYSSEYLKTPVITDAKEAVEYLSSIQPENEHIAIIIDELTDLIAFDNEIQDILINLMKNPEIHIIASANKIDRLTNGLTGMFGGHVVFIGDKVGEYQYISHNPFNFEQSNKVRSIL